jgi:peptidoglycan-associated lipoprotein
MVRARPTQLVCAIVAVLVVAGCSSTPESGSDTGGTGQGVQSPGRPQASLNSASPDSEMRARLEQIGDRVFFEYDKTELRPEGRDLVQKWASFLAQYPAAKVTIEGHCDERGTREYNLALGERRADAAKAYLVLIGADERRVSVISYGKERPSVLGSAEQSWAQNRRAVLTID